MTILDFHGIAAERIPTAKEMVSFAVGQGWKIVDNGEKAALRVPNATDPLAVKFAKLLSREPYRTNVLEEVRRAQFDLNDEPRPDAIAGAVPQRGE